MTIDIIIPSYNQQDYLPDAIESALEQKCGVIVVEDGSTDSSLLIAQGYKHKNLKIINQVNKGLASARNTGIMNSKADYLLFLDADDILLDNAVAQIKKVIKKTDADIISPSFKEFGLSNREVILMEKPTIEDFKTGNRVGYCSAIRRSVLLEAGGYSPRMVEGYEDLHLTCDLLSRGKKLVTMSEVLWLYRVKQTSMYTKIMPDTHLKLIGQINKDFNVGLEF
jgi:glycosyltransferase involved in cell wall biosynthesis